MREESIIIKDPLYKQILFPTKYKYLLDDPAFQRLRYVKQTSFTYLVYPSANHTRFSHSIGAFHLMNKVLTNGLITIDSKHHEELLLASLLHDIGHGPFSHMWERVFDHFNHEEETQKILYEQGLDNVAEILKGNSSFSPLISSSLDVDKLDYMARDSYFCGVSYGLLEGDFILEHLYIKDNKLTIMPSALSSVEDLITQRVNLFKTVYFHKISLEYDFIFEQIFKRAKELYEQGFEISRNDYLLSFFKKTNTSQDLIHVTDDVVLSQIREWRDFDDDILSDFSDMFLNRRKLKSINLAHNKVDTNKIYEIVKQSHYDENYYFGYVSIPITLVQTEFYVDFGDSLKPVEEVSDLINFYKNKKKFVECVFFPRELECDLMYL